MRRQRRKLGGFTDLADLAGPRRISYGAANLAFYDPRYLNYLRHCRRRGEKSTIGGFREWLKQEAPA